MDVWDPFMSSTAKHIADANSKMVFDRFHVIKHVNGVVDTIRKEENGRLAKESIMDLQGYEAHMVLFI